MRPIKAILSDFWYNVKRGIPNLFIWAPVVWKDRWWDHHFFFVLLHKKLSLMEKNFRKYGHHTMAERDADNMKIAVNLLDRIIKDEYHEMVYKHHDEKWGEMDFQFIPCEDREGFSELHVEYANAKTDEDKKQQRKEYKQLMKRPEELKAQDKDMLFKILKKHIFTWWD